GATSDRPRGVHLEPRAVRRSGRRPPLRRLLSPHPALTSRKRIASNSRSSHRHAEVTTVSGGVETGGTPTVCALGENPADVLAHDRFPTTDPALTLDAASAGRCKQPRRHGRRRLLLAQEQQARHVGVLATSETN